jgi:hypothetical protein
MLRSEERIRDNGVEESTSRQPDRFTSRSCIGDVDGR